MPVVVHFDGGIEPHERVKLLHRAVLSLGGDVREAARAELITGNPRDAKGLVAGELVTRRVLSTLKLERENPHPNEIAPVNAFIAFCNHRLHT